MLGTSLSANIWRDKEQRKGTIVYMAKKFNPLNTLHHVPLFITCSQKELKRIYLQSTEKSFKAGEIIAYEGDTARCSRRRSHFHGEMYTTVLAAACRVKWAHIHAEGGPMLSLC